MTLIEVQVDRIVGPTHHFGGLGVGNVASQSHAGDASNPAAAALQGLDKMRMVAGLGIPQVVLPPQRRPKWRFLRSLGFGGSDAEVLRRAADQAPRLLSAALSSSAMWTANAATASAAVDNESRQLTLTVANLISSVHRAMEPAETLADLRRCFPAARVVPALPGGTALRDEGAANHMRLGSETNSPGLHLFVYGDGDPQPASYWPRQSRQACETIARCHRLPQENTFFLKQHPDAIDAGAFHNDVVAASHHRLLIFHEQAFYRLESPLQEICDRYAQRYRRALSVLPVNERTLPLSRAVSTYLFNSQILSVAGAEQPVMLCPSQVKEDADARRLVQSWRDDHIFSEIHYVDLRQSMSGGGGPACLRLRVPMNAAAAANLDARMLWSEKLDGQLRSLIEQHYPPRVTLAELTDLEFIRQAEHTTQRLRDLLS